MSVQFNSLFTLAINHGFYTDICRDFDFVWSAKSAATLKRGRLLTKVIDGRLYCLYEANSAGNPIKNIAGERLLLGLKLKNPFFNNFTDYNYSAALPLYRNVTAATALDPPVSVVPTGRLLTHTVTDTTRPVELILRDATGLSLESESFSLLNTRSDTNFDLKGFGEGFYSVSEIYPAGSQLVNYFYDEEFFRSALFGFVEIEIDTGFYSSTPDFEISFNARSETVKYYVVADNYTETEFAQLAIADVGFTEESRPQINFTRLASTAFAADDITPDSLGRENSRVTVFKSQTSVSRQQAARKRIQLSRNGDILVSNLPAPGVDKARADFVIHVAKP